MRAASGVCSRESTTTRGGWRAVCTWRTSRRGSSSSTVPTPGEQGAGAPAPGMAVAARRLAGDPLAGAVVEGGAAVERDRCLEAQPGPAPFHARDEADVELACSLADGAVGYVDHVDAGGGQPRRTLACHQRIRVAHGHDDAADAGGDESVRTRWRAAVVRARLERDDDRGAAHIGASGCRVAQCHHLRVRTAGLLRVAATGDAAVGSDDDAADPWIRLREAERLSGQCQRLAHEDVVWRRRGRGRRVVVHGSARCRVRINGSCRLSCQG